VSALHRAGRLRKIEKSFDKGKHVGLPLRVIAPTQFFDFNRKDLPYPCGLAFFGYGTHSLAYSVPPKAYKYVFQKFLRFDNNHQPK